MNNIIKLLIVLVVLFFICSCCADEYDNPVPIEDNCIWYLDEDFPDDIKSLIVDAVEDINIDVLREDYFVYGGTVSKSYRTDMDDRIYDEGIYLREENFYGRYVMAIASWTGYPCNFEIHVDPRSLDEDTVDIRTMVWHEIGHTFNLMHIDEPKCIMNSYVQSDTDLSDDPCGYGDLVREALAESRVDDLPEKATKSIEMETL